MVNEIFVFGLGHLGSFLLKENSEYSMYTIVGTKRTDDGTALPFTLGSSLPRGIKRAYKSVIFSLPPRDGYEDLLTECDRFFDDDTPWVFISSTSAIDHNFFLAHLEKRIMQMDRKVTILRPGGLVDRIRHPKNFFKGKEEIKACNSPVNLIHTVDVARGILHIIANELYGKTFNLVTDDHPKRRDFYGKFLGNEIKMNPEGSVEDRVISNEEIKATGFVLRYPRVSDYF